MEPEEIERKADKARKQKSKTPKVKLKPLKHPVDAYSFKVYARIFPSTYRFMLWVYFVLTPALVFIIMYFMEDGALWELYLGLAILTVFIVRWIVEKLRIIFTYGSYVNFNKRLPFPVTGWDVLGRNPNMLKAEYWGDNCSVAVQVKPTATAANVKLINDAIFLFCEGANNMFYEAQIGRDGRRRWTPNGLSATGSADIGVYSEMYKFINVYMASIYKKYPVVQSVHITIHEEVSEVPHRPEVM